MSTSRLTGIPPVVNSDSGSHNISNRISLNFSVAKVISIFLVVFGHWIGDGFFGLPVWIPVTFGLFIFAFSSGYFTAKIYGSVPDRADFWRNKIKRLGVRYWIILVFISCIVIIQGRTLFHWHSLIHFLGLSGLLNWFDIHNRSALGAGLWFFTLLILFYITYPWIARMSRNSAMAMTLVVGGGVIAVLLQYQVKIGHELWLTAYGFIVGVVFGVQNLKASASASLLAAVVLCLLLFGLSSKGIKEFNPIFISGVSLAVACWLIETTIPRNVFTIGIAWWEKYLLEIFLIHSYLFMRATGLVYTDFLISLALILIVSISVARLADWVGRPIFLKRT